MTSLTQTQQFFVPLDVQDRNISQSGQAINEEWESSLVQQNHGSLNGEDRNSSKSGRITNEEWESVKGEIEQIYIDQGKTLSATMQMIEEKYHLKASERKWKLKLKEWGFEKYLPATAMKILVAKAERRAVVENKDTVFFHGKTQIAPERIDLFKKRKAFREGPMASPSQKTPANVFYFTPCTKNPAAPSVGPLDGDTSGSGCEIGCVITISEFLAHQKSVKSTKQSITISRPSSPPPQDVSSATSDKGLMPPADLLDSKIPSIDQTTNNIYANGPLPSEVSNLFDYVHFVCKERPGPLEDINHLYPAWYSEVAINIALVLLPIGSFLRSDSSLSDGDLQDLELFASDETPTSAEFTRHSRRLFSETVRALFVKSGPWGYAAEDVLKAVQVVESIFQLELDLSIWPFYTFTLAQSHETRGENDAAELCYRQAIKCYIKRDGIDDLFGDQSDLLKCQDGLGNLLGRMNREQEALLVLVHGLTDYLARCWPLTRTADPGHQPSKHNLLLKLSSPPFQNVMRSLQLLHLMMERDDTFAWVRGSISRLQHLDYSSLGEGEEFLLELMKLGAAYSDIWYFDVANLVYRFAAPRLEVFNSRPHAFERAIAFRDYAQHYEKLGSSEEQSQQLQLAVRCIGAVYVYDASNGLLFFDAPKSVSGPSRLVGDFQGVSQVGELPGPGPLETYFESVAREDAELSRWIH